jgi:hypothetical protein
MSQTWLCQKQTEQEKQPLHFPACRKYFPSWLAAWVVTAANSMASICWKLLLCQASPRSGVRGALPGWPAPRVTRPKRALRARIDGVERTRSRKYMVGFGRCRQKTDWRPSPGCESCQGIRQKLVARCESSHPPPPGSAAGRGHGTYSVLLSRSVIACHERLSASASYLMP